MSGDEIHPIPLLNLVVELLLGYPGISFGGNVIVILHGKFGVARRHCRLIPCALAGFSSLPVHGRRQGFAMPSNTSETSSIVPVLFGGWKPRFIRHEARGQFHATLREIANAEGMDMTQIRRKIADPSCTEYQRLYKKRT